jgi:predicted dehydrogenase
MERELPILLEKPIATTIDDLRAMWGTYYRRQPKLVVGFCMRFVPFYNQIRKVIDKGTLGQILTINAEELLSDRLSMIFCRSQWRPDTSLAGPILLEKCCHDIDMINWMAGSQAHRVSSYARKTFLVPGKAPDRKCQNCPEENTCRFSQKRVLESFKFNITETKTENYALYSKLINNQCPYFTGSPYPDHQSVMIEYENGVLVPACEIGPESCVSAAIEVNLGTHARQGRAAAFRARLSILKALLHADTGQAGIVRNRHFTRSNYGKARRNVQVLGVQQRGQAQ